jgi:hypothetical protein
MCPGYSSISCLSEKDSNAVDRAVWELFDYTSVTSTLSNRLAQTIDRPTFIKLLTDDLPAEMKVEKSTLLLLEGDHLELQAGSNAFSIARDDEIGKYCPQTKGQSALRMYGI